jgi:hypothetical protein
LACDIGVRKKPKLDRGPKPSSAIRQPANRMTAGVRQPIVRAAGGGVRAWRSLVSAGALGQGCSTYLVAACEVPKRILVIGLIRRAHGLHSAPPCYRATPAGAWLAFGFGLAALLQKCYILICSM